MEATPSVLFSQTTVILHVVGFAFYFLEGLSLSNMYLSLDQNNMRFMMLCKMIKNMVYRGTSIS